MANNATGAAGLAPTLVQVYGVFAGMVVSQRVETWFVGVLVC